MAEMNAEFKEAPIVWNVFKKELELMQTTVKDFVTDCFGQMCPNYFWYIPASVKGHHPPICRTRGGLVHHTKLAVGFADGFCDMWDNQIDMLQRDQIIAGVMLHDMMKRGLTDDELDTWEDHRQANRGHGRYCANEIIGYLDSQQWRADEEAKFMPIIKAIELHMGRWTLDVTAEELFELENNIVVRTVHLADYTASRALHQYLAERAMDKELMSYLY
jgi:hypothetical protein